MLCETCKKSNENIGGIVRFVLNPTKITKCFIDNDNDTHKRIYEDGLEEYSSIKNPELLHNPTDPALVELGGVSWYYEGNEIDSASIIENKTIKTRSGQVGVILKLVEGKIHQALIGDEKLLVAII